jgi:dTDP-4-dehydrorhamnose reductase
MTMRILVTGRDGQVGRALAARSWLDGEVAFLGRQDCDLSDPATIRATVRQLAPAVIVNAGAYTAVDQAEKERELCFAVNAAAPGVLAEEASRLGAMLIHYSTDYVFSGEKPAPYVETDAIDPLNVYGASKAQGEEAIRKAHDRYLILRTTWVYAAQGRNFLRTMLRLAADRPELRVVDDQIGAPTSAGAIASATVRLVSQYAGQDGSIPAGTYHMTAGESTSWYGFAQAIFDGVESGPKPRLLPIGTADYPTPAKRPRNSVLSNEKFENTFGFRLTSWRTQLKEVLEELSLPA